MAAIRLAFIILCRLVTSSSVLAQEVDKPGGRMLCPRPTTETIGLKDAPTPIAQDFSAGANAAVQAGVNDPATNRFFRHTFQMKPRRCCQVVSGTLTVTTVANQAGTTTQASDAGNDMIGIVHMGATVPGMGGMLYSGPVAAGFTKTTPFQLNAAAMANIDATNRLSFNVQDDSRVTKAILYVERCCVGKE